MLTSKPGHRFFANEIAQQSSGYVRQTPFNLKKSLLLTALAFCGAVNQLHAAEAVVNGGFNNDGASWTRFIYYSNYNLNPSPYAVQATVAATDYYGNGLTRNIFTIDNTSGWNGGIVSNAISQKVNLIANTQYKLTFKARVEAPGASDVFVSIRKTDQSPGYVDAPTVVEKRVSVTTTGFATYTIYFTTPANLSGDTHLFISGASIHVLGAQRAKVGLADVSITDNPSFTQNVVYYMNPTGTQVAIDINQVGYLGRDKPLVFTVRGYSQSWEQYLVPALYRNGVKVSSVPAATLVQTGVDTETGERVLTFSMNVSSLTPAVDAQTGEPYGMRTQGYQIRLDHAGTPYPPSRIFSQAFQIGADVYGTLAVDALNYFKANRANEVIGDIARRAVHSRGETFTNNSDGTVKSYKNSRPAGPLGDSSAACRGGLDNFGNDFTSTPCTFKNGVPNVPTKGWFDAGDQGKYVINGGVALWTLQNQIERIQSGLASAVNSDQLKKLQEEAKYEMDFMLSMQAKPETKAYVPVGWQGDKLSASGVAGIYQVPFGDKRTVAHALADNAAGVVAYNGGNLPRLQVKLNLTNEDVSGMVFHSLYDETWTSLPTAPGANNQKRLLSYPTSAATYNFVAVAAQCYRIFKNVDLAYANTCKSAAHTAWTAAEARRVAGKDIFRYEYANNDWSAVDTSKANDLVLKNGFGLLPQWSGGGAYGDLRLKDEIYWAAMELYLATDDGNYLVTARREVSSTNDTGSGQWSGCQAVSGQTYTQNSFPVHCYPWVNGFDWQNVMALGTLSAVSADKNAFPAAAKLNPATVPFTISYTDSANVVRSISFSVTPKANVLAYANALKNQVSLQAFRFPKTPYSPTNRDTDYEWGSNGSILNRSIVLATAYDLTADKSYANAATGGMDFILGRNGNGMSYVTGYGQRAAQYPHHRYWAKLAHNSYPEAQPGVLLGGANSRDIQAIFANADHCTSRQAVAPFACTGTFDPAVIGPGDQDNKYFMDKVVSKCMTSSLKSPQKCFADSHHSFASSEVAINWNAPLTWMATFMQNYGPK